MSNGLGIRLRSQVVLRFLPTQEFRERREFGRDDKLELEEV
jgi:hypothetical protein